MSSATPDPSPRKSRAWLWALLPIVLGGVLLLGGAGAGLWFALRGAPVAASGPSAPSAAVALSPAPTPGPPRLELPSIDEPPGEERELAVSVQLPPSPPGEQVRPAEERALLPLTHGAAIWGISEAPVTLSLFGDLECEYTRAELRSALRLTTRLGPRLRVVFYHRPLSTHSHADQAARVLAAVALQLGPDAAFRVLSRAAESRQAPDSEELQRWLTAAGVSASLVSLSSDNKAQQRVSSDARLSEKLDVQATPTVFVNGRRLIGRHTDAELDALIADEARASRFMIAQGIPFDQVYARRVQKNLIGVGEGADSRVCLPVERAPTTSPRAALVTITEFSDFECRHCRALEPALAAVMRNHAGLVRRVWHSFAVPQHTNAERVAAFVLSARALSGERAFWALHAALLSGAADLGDGGLRALAVRLGLDSDRIGLSATDARFGVVLQADRALAESVGVEGTPTLFVNGRKLAGAVPESVLEGVVREELEAARRIVKAGTPVDELEAVLCGG